MKLSMKNKFSNHTLFPEIPTFLEITANQTLFIVGSVLNLFTLGAAHEYRTRKIFKHVIQYLHVSNVQQLTNQIPCYYSY